MSAVLARRTGRKRGYPMKAAVVIAACTLVCLDTSGLAIPAATAGGTDKLAGLAPMQADNSTGANKAVTVEVEHDELLLLNAGDITDADVGSKAYLSAINTVSLSHNTNTRPVAGTIIQLEDGKVWVKPEIV
ncbi:hypothetical protein L1D34_07250 [Vibrio mediterranei]|uniref:hypothetical protein n=1 Tax=Vibrio mediterranei TaxID=689 RepID=UPI001EFD8669|nr:hypothetical protein [Vibrio mediterranei]MCG9624635.1 hypothetical protein [Vibrio mediterranei]